MRAARGDFKGFTLPVIRKCESFLEAQEETSRLRDTRDRGSKVARDVQ